MRDRSFWFLASFRLSYRVFKPAPSPKPCQKPKILAPRWLQFFFKRSNLVFPRCGLCYFQAMIQLPKRNSLVHETASTLKQWIADGILKDVLPGELDLKERLRVGRDTLRLALELLMDEGWVEPSAQGRKRRIHAKKISGL